MRIAVQNSKFLVTLKDACVAGEDNLNRRTKTPFLAGTNGPMSEQYPLLYEEVSEEESPRFRRQLPITRGRARNHVKGAAAIFKRWPGHWTILLNFWWMGIGMLALTTYILYSCIFSYVVLQSTNNPPHTPISIKIPKLIPKTSSQPKVFMHIFVNDKQEVNLNDYLPYIEIITNKYKNFQYELIIVANDTNGETKKLNDRENNDIALNMLWDDNFSESKISTTNKNLIINHVTLSKYLYDSPLKNLWRSVPNQFIKFLVRAISIWDKGGIAFDPIILTPQSPNAIYIDKVYNILKKFKTRKVKTHHKNTKQLIFNKKISRPRSKPNNIRDIINALENESTTEQSFQEPLAEVETKDFTVTAGRKLLSVVVSSTKNETTVLRQKEAQNIDSNYSKIHVSDHRNQEIQFENAPKLNLLPMFLDYLFHNTKTKHSNDTLTTSMPKESSGELKSSQIRDFLIETPDKNNNNPIIISAKAIVEKPDNEIKIPNVIDKDVETLFEVTIDLKGNIIATDTACHAFIGNMFTNSVHHDEYETVTDFIIKELSVFCKGLFASCKGIDVILL